MERDLITVTCPEHDPLMVTAHHNVRADTAGHCSKATGMA